MKTSFVVGEQIIATESANSGIFHAGEIGTVAEVTEVGTYKQGTNQWPAYVLTVEIGQRRIVCLGDKWESYTDLDAFRTWLQARNQEWYDRQPEQVRLQLQETVRQAHFLCVGHVEPDSREIVLETK